MIDVSVHVQLAEISACSTFLHPCNGRHAAIWNWSASYSYFVPELIFQVWEWLEISHQPTFLLINGSDMLDREYSLHNLSWSSTLIYCYVACTGIHSMYRDCAEFKMSTLIVFMNWIMQDVMEFL